MTCYRGLQKVTGGYMDGWKSDRRVTLQLTVQDQLDPFRLLNLSKDNYPIYKGGLAYRWGYFSPSNRIAPSIFDRITSVYFY